MATVDVLIANNSDVILSKLELHLLHNYNNNKLYLPHYYNKVLQYNYKSYLNWIIDSFFN